MLDAAAHQALALTAPHFATAECGRELAWLRDHLTPESDPIEVLRVLAARQPFDEVPRALRAVGGWLEARLTLAPDRPAVVLALEAGWLRRLARTAAHLGEAELDAAELPERFGAPETLEALAAERARLEAAAAEAPPALEAEVVEAAEVDLAPPEVALDVEDPLLGLGLAGLAVGGVDLGGAPLGDGRLPEDALAPERPEPNPADSVELADLPLGLRLVDLAPDDPEPDLTAAGLDSIFGDLDDPE